MRSAGSDLDKLHVAEAALAALEATGVMATAFVQLAEGGDRAEEVVEKQEGGDEVGDEVEDSGSESDAESDADLESELADE